MEPFSVAQRRVLYVAVVLALCLHSCTDSTGPVRRSSDPPVLSPHTTALDPDSWAIFAAVETDLPADGPRTIGILDRERSQNRTLVLVIDNREGRTYEFYRRESGNWRVGRELTINTGWFAYITPMNAEADPIPGQRMGEVRDAFNVIMDENWPVEHYPAGVYTTGPHSYPRSREAYRANYIQPPNWEVNGSIFRIALREWRAVATTYSGVTWSRTCATTQCDLHWTDEYWLPDTTLHRDSRGANELTLAWQIIETPPLYVSTISGPTTIPAVGWYDYSVTSSGGTGTYTFSWVHQVHGIVKTESNSTGSSTYSARVEYGDVFDLSVEVTSGDARQSRTIRVDGSNALYARITGHTKLMTPGYYTYEIIPQGGAGSYTYQWSGDSWGTGKTFRLYAEPCDSGMQYSIRATVYSGGYSYTAYYSVLNLTDPALCSYGK
jgi:hypothetical protein